MILDQKNEKDIYILFQPSIFSFYVLSYILPVESQTKAITWVV
jgi:hypothetical protein